MFSVQCCVCSKQVNVTKKRLQTSRQIFCDIECCKTKWRSTHVTRECSFCHRSFTQPQSVRRTLFCSWNCYSEAGMPSSVKSGKHGTYVSHKVVIGKNEVHYDSSLELRRMKELDSDPSVESWCRSTHRVPWIDDTGKSHTYFPDFDVLYATGTLVVEEVKGYCDRASELKITAAKKYFANSLAIYRVINQRDFFDFQHAYEVYRNSFGSWSRPTTEHIYMQMAHLMKERSTCIRRQVGAVFTDDNFTRVICFGYNGGISGDANECESLLEGQCGCIHAEVNAMTKAVENLTGSTLFVTLAPCMNCAKILINRGIKKVFVDQKYRDRKGIELLKKHGVEVIRWDDFVAACDKKMHAVISRP